MATAAASPAPLQSCSQCVTLSGPGGEQLCVGAVSSSMEDWRNGGGVVSLSSPTFTFFTLLYYLLSLLLTMIYILFFLYLIEWVWVQVCPVEGYH